MSGLGLSTGLRALLSARYALDTVGHNIANASTPGYSRQSVRLGAALPVQRGQNWIGTGANVLGVDRKVDDLLQRRIFTQFSLSGRLDTRFTGLGELESYFNEPSAGLGSVIDAFFGGIASLSAQPEDSILRVGAVAAGAGLAGAFRELHGNATTLRAGFVDEMRAGTGEVNRLAEEIAQLNREIGKLEGDGGLANDLRDARDRALKELAGLVDVQTTDGGGSSVRVLVSGSLLVDAGSAHELELETDASGAPSFHVGGSAGAVDIRGGKLGGLLDLHRAGVPQVTSELDRLARNLILELNRVHSTGVPGSGSFQSLLGANRVQDRDGDGALEDELLSKSGLPFAVEGGELWVNVRGEEDGSVERHRIAISSTHTTVGGLLQSLNDVPELSASIDALGRVQINAQSGFRFDFGNGLDPNPNAAGTLGGGQATLGTPLPGPYALGPGDTLDLSVDSGSGPIALSIAFAAGDFQAIGAAKASEIAAVINADAGAQAAGIQAVGHGDALYLQSAGAGADQSFEVTGGAAASALGWSAQIGQTIAGADQAVSVSVSGSYTGELNQSYSFRPNMDGSIGTTPGLKIDVFDGAGKQVASLEVGAGYQPGSALAVADGIEVEFGVGNVSSSANQAFELSAVADADTSDVLVALGLNSLFVGHDAATIALRADIENDPNLLASSLAGASGDASALLGMLDVQNQAVAGLGGATFASSYGELVSGLGFETSAAKTGLESNEALLGSLELRREQLSGVNVDEELVKMIEFEQAFGAASRYISALNALHQDLLDIL